MSSAVQETAGPGSGTRIGQAGELRSARIESLRALAALSVLESHAFLYSYGAVLAGAPLWHKVALEGGLAGVDFFFVLSGYLLFWPFARAAFGAGGPVDLRRYALNRALRILPLYYFVLVVLLIAQHGGGSGAEWWHYGLFLQNFFVPANVDVPMWSLAVEVQFYVVLPLVALLVARLGRGSLRRAAAVLLALGLASFALQQVFVGQASSPDYRWEFSLPTLFYFFCAGMALALLRLHWQSARPRLLDGPLGNSTLWLLAALPLWVVVAAAGTYWAEPVKAVASVLIIGACVLPVRSGVGTRVVEWRPLSRLGLASYGLYLWQVPVILAIATGDLAGGAAPALHQTPGRYLVLLVSGIAATSAVALVTYAFVEAPALRLRRRWSSSLPASRPGLPKLRLPAASPTQPTDA